MVTNLDWVGMEDRVTARDTEEASSDALAEVAARLWAED